VSSSCGHEKEKQDVLNKIKKNSRRGRGRPRRERTNFLSAATKGKEARRRIKFREGKAKVGEDARVERMQHAQSGKVLGSLSTKLKSDNLSIGSLGNQKMKKSTRKGKGMVSVGKGEGKRGAKKKTMGETANHQEGKYPSQIPIDDSGKRSSEGFKQTNEGGE